MFDEHDDDNRGAPPDCRQARDLGYRAPVIALHCSGANGRQWRNLAATLGSGFSVSAPDLIGCGNTGRWHGEEVFTLMAEAENIVAMVEAMPAPVHLVGHSYGGAVALLIAYLHPARIASLSLYEPSTFHILKQLGWDAELELGEIEELAAAVARGLVDGAYHAASAAFIDYWCGKGTWAKHRAEARADMIRWLPKAPLDFRALLEADVPLECYRTLTVPTLILRGDTTRAPSRRIVEALGRWMPASRIETITGAGHMGPVTHAEHVLASISTHIRKCTPTARDWHERPPSLCGAIP